MPGVISTLDAIPEHTAAAHGAPLVRPPMTCRFGWPGCLCGMASGGRGFSYLVHPSVCALPWCDEGHKGWERCYWRLLYGLGLGLDGIRLPSQGTSPSCIFMSNVMPPAGLGSRRPLPGVSVTQ